MDHILSLNPRRSSSVAMRRKNARLRARVLISGGCGLFAHISVAQRCYSSSKTRPRKSAHRGPGAVRTHSRSGYSHARRVKRRSERAAATFSPKAPDGPLLSAARRADSAEGTIGGVKEGVFFFLFFFVVAFFSQSRRRSYNRTSACQRPVSVFDLFSLRVFWGGGRRGGERVSRSCVSSQLEQRVLTRGLFLGEESRDKKKRRAEGFPVLCTKKKTVLKRR